MLENRLFREIIAIIIGGGVGSLCRFALSAWMQKRMQNIYFPWGILTVNLIGCLLIGILFGLLVTRFEVGAAVRAGIFIGVLGGFTTFSSFSLDAVNLISSGSYGGAVFYVLLSVGGGILATALGLMVVKLI